MKTLDRHELEVLHMTRSNPTLRGWRGQFTPEFVGRFPPFAGVYSEGNRGLDSRYERE